MGCERRTTPVSFGNRKRDERRTRTVSPDAGRASIGSRGSPSRARRLQPLVSSVLDHGKAADASVQGGVRGKSCSCARWPAFSMPSWYQARYPDVAAADPDPLLHFIRHGLAERRDPNPILRQRLVLRALSRRRCQRNASRCCIICRPAQRNYATRIPTSTPPGTSANIRRPPPIHCCIISKPVWHSAIPPKSRSISEITFRPNRHRLPLPRKIIVDVVIPVYRGLEETRRCIASVLANTARPLGRIIVVDDRSPEPELSAWLQDLAGTAQDPSASKRPQHRFRRVGQSRHGGSRFARRRAAEQRHRGSAGLAAPADRPGLRRTTHRDGVAVLQQCNDLRLSGQRRRSDRLRPDRRGTGPDLPDGERRPRGRCPDNRRLLHVYPPQGAAGGRATSTPNVSPSATARKTTSACAPPTLAGTTASHATRSSITRVQSASAIGQTSCAQRAMKLILERYPDYRQRVASHVASARSFRSASPSPRRCSGNRGCR